MNRLRATIVCDIRLQFRNGFYYAALFVAAVTILVLRQLSAFDLAYWLPVILLNNLLIGTFYFIGGLILLEKGEGTLAAQVVTPLRTAEYLAAKLITLTGLAVVENVAIVALSGVEFSLLPLLVAIVLASLLLCLFGFVAVVRYDAINEYLLPSVLYLTLLLLPMLDYLALLPSPLYAPHPMTAPLALLAQACHAEYATSPVLAIIAALAWLAAMLLLSLRRFQQFVVRQQGGT